MPRDFTILFSSTHNGGMGLEGKRPWSISSEILSFVQITRAVLDDTKRNAVVMGRHTWNALPKKPLAGRVNIVLTSEGVKPPESGGVYFTRSLDAALAACGPEIEHVYIVGGAMLIQEAMIHPSCKTIIQTLILDDVRCDAFAPLVDRSRFGLYSSGEVTPSKDGQPAFQVLTYQRATEESQYVNLMLEVLRLGKTRKTAAGQETLSLFGARLRFSLRESFPLFTIAEVDWAVVVSGILACLHGGMDDKNAVENVYYRQWRKFGTDTDGVDQIAHIIRTIKSNPTSRQLILTTVNPVQKSAVMPCHCLVQFNVSDGELNCSLYQRSGEIGKGVPLSVARYALLTTMIAIVTGLKPGDLDIAIGDVYLNTLDVKALSSQAKRRPRPFPTVEIARAVKDIDEFTDSDFQLKGYQPC